jgi:tetratricopeptide (TPR) repeat protein
MCKALLALIPLAVFAADNLLPKADRSPHAPTPEQRQMIQEGVALHDRGDYDAAIAKYKQVLDAAPDEVGALHELCFTYYAKKDYGNSLATARLGARYKSPLLPRFQMMIGNILDDTGKRDQAIAVYRAAIKQSPRTALLHFNLGLSLIRSGKPLNARAELEEAVSLDPNHASSHYQLGSLYAQMGYRIPALLALSRFLLLEPAGERAQKALEIVEPVVRGNVADRPDGTHITIVQSPAGLKGEGDFDTVEFAIGIGTAAGRLDAHKGQSPFQARVDIYLLVGDVLSRMKPTGFAARYYAPFFAALHDRKFVEAFVSTAFGAKLEGASEWLAQNADKMGAFKDWLKAYQWPAAE